MSTIDKFPIPGVSQPGQAGDAASGSLLSELRATASKKRQQSETTLELPGRWKGKLRARYGTIGLDELERFQNVAIADGENLSTSLEILGRACKAIEGIDPTDGEWRVIEDELGPVTFDDRLAKLLEWERPDEEYLYSTRDVYERMFDYDGLAVGRHVSQVATFLGLVEEEVASGKPSTGGSLTRSAPPPHLG